MRFSLFSLLLVLLFSGSAIAADFHAEADEFFSQCVADGLVDYDGLHADPSTLNDLVEQIGSFKLLGSKSDLAFYINAYNLLVIKNVLDNYPLASPLDVPGFFDKTTFLVAGEKRTLNDIENNIVRPTFKDARIHFALVCGALGCPVLGNKSFLPSNYDKLLDVQTRTAMDNPTFIQVKESESTVYISEIFKWYMEDFGTTESEVLAYINRYRSTQIPSNYKIDYYSYDWKLNKQ